MDRSIGKLPGILCFLSIRCRIDSRSCCRVWQKADILLRKVWLARSIHRKGREARRLRKDWLRILELELCMVLGRTAMGNRTRSKALALLGSKLVESDNIWYSWGKSLVRRLGSEGSKVRESSKACRHKFCRRSSWLNCFCVKYSREFQETMLNVRRPNDEWRFFVWTLKSCWLRSFIFLTINWLV